jgi:HEAT repeat protein
MNKIAKFITTTSPDAGLIGELIDEIRVSSRIVGSYPRDHPAVQNALQRVYAALQKIFHQRNSITLAVGKDSFLIDANILDKKNLRYKQLAQHLRRLGVAHITFSPGLTLDELYNFQHFISHQGKDFSGEKICDIFNNYDLPHINVGFLDYEAFSFEDGKTATEIPQEDLWETYIAGIINGTLRIEELSEEIGDIPLDTFARLLGVLENRGIDRICSQKIVSLHVKKFFQKSFSNREIRRLLAFIKELPSNLQEQFLCAVIETFSRDILITSRIFKNISAELIMELFEAIQSKKIDIPENLRNLLDVVLNFDAHPVDQRTIGDKVLVDDIFLPSSMEDIPSESNGKEVLSDSFETSASDEYQKEIKHMLDFDAAEMVSMSLPELKREIDDDFIQKTFNNVILEIISSDVVSQTEYLQFLENLKEQITQFIVTGQYEQVLRIRKLLQLNVEKGKFADATTEALKHSSTPEFFSAFIDSLKIMGRQARDQAWLLCEGYGEMIIPFLMRALVDEETPASRSLLLSLIRQFGDTLVAEALRRLNDSRWFVKRNMLYLLRGCKDKEIIPHVRPYCEHENPKVSFEAMKCLLSLKDNYAVEKLTAYLRSGTQAEIEQAITLAGVYAMEEAVPELIRMLKATGRNRSALPLKTAIVQALGSIGDVRSLDALREILFRRKFFLFKGGKENLQVEIYKTMKNYPYEYIEDILQKGLKSRNEYIRNESLRLTKMRKQ